MSSSPQAPIHAVTADANTRPSLTVLSGFWPAATFAVARALLAADESLLLVRHDLTGIRDGVVRRVVRSDAGIIEDQQVGLRHGCVSCTLREDVLPTLVRLTRSHPGQDLVLMLPEVVEPEAVAAAGVHCLIDGAPITDLLRVDSYVTVLDAEHLLDGLASSDDLAALGIQAAQDDYRALADVVVRQIEYADTLVLWGQSQEGEFDTGRLSVPLQRMAPWAAHIRVDGDRVDASMLTRQLRHTRRHRPETPGVLARGLQGYLLGEHEPEPDCGVVSAVFRARRPFHPQRLHDVLEEVNAEVIRSRGHLWLASQPDTVVAWEFAGGGLAMGSLGHWLVSLPEGRWEHVCDQRRLAAALDWDPYYGDRHQHLVFIGLDLDAVELHRALADCLLTDAELADGEEVWRTYHDPFAGCFPLEGEELTDTDTETETEGAQPA
ncbi:cobalamin biosynthesis protein CobW [Micromonospora sp. KC606]|uniref:CobW family GTP-binding protein n=1 Tax=Micromonospora sp. KC606 TaxID=2530379 RepID=UPI0010504005|nr:GTP-binding protein [Micromonospora sp. KC606]TDC85539.1 cobalamin biosynthesis protein CobW [Micromonospora sp. KC606]